MTDEPLASGDFPKYPYLPESMKYITRYLARLDLGHMDDRSVEEELGIGYAELRDLIGGRLISAIRDGISKVDDRYSSQMYDAVSMASFIISSIVVRASNDPFIISRFSLAEGRRSERFLLDELENNSMAGRQVAVYVFQGASGCSLTMDLELTVPCYLRLAPQYLAGWKLVNRSLSNGYVKVLEHEVGHIFREAVAKKIRGIIEGMPQPTLDPSLKGLIGDILKYKPKPPAVITRPERYPPCINVALKKLKDGENLPHSARFMLATYLLRVGLSEDEVASIFVTAPDYNERVTRYQVQQISGRKAGREGYLVPSCRKLLTEGLCYRDESCGTITSPLQYGGHTGGRTSASGPKPDSPKEAQP